MATAARTVPAGPAHVAVVSFLAARGAPAGGFWIALAGGVAVARAAERLGARLAQNAATTAFFIWVITGGLDAYAGTYDAIGRRVGLEIGSADALVLTAIGLAAWAAFASTVQVLVYRRGLASWDALAAHATDIDPNMSGQRQPDEEQHRFDPRAVTLAALVAFGLLLTSTEWAVLAAVSVWLTLAWAAAKPDKEPLKTGLAFAALLAGGAFLFGLGAGLGLDVAL